MSVLAPSSPTLTPPPPSPDGPSGPERRSRSRDGDVESAAARSRRQLAVTVFAALAGCLALFATLRWLAHVPDLDAQWQVRDHERVILFATGDPRLLPQVGRTLVALEAGGRRVSVTPALLLATPRWTADDRARAALVEQRRLAATILAEPVVAAVFADGSRVEVRPAGRGWFAPDALFWLLGAAALTVHLVACLTVAIRPRPFNLLFLAMAVALALQLLWLGADGTRCLVPAPLPLADDLPWRLGLDLLGGAAALHALTLYPVRHSGRRWIGPLGWAVAAVTAAAAAGGWVPNAWALGQGVLAGFGLAAAAVLSTALQAEPHPLLRLLRRLVLLMVSALLPLSLMVAVVGQPPQPRHDLVLLAVVAWTLFFSVAVVWVPFIVHGRPPLREIVLLAGFSSMVTTLHLLLVAGAGVDPAVSFVAVMALAIPTYVVVRRWLLRQLATRDVLSNVALFEQLYRTTRAVREQPQRIGPAIADLMREVFEPQELQLMPPAAGQSRVSADGSTLVVPTAWALAEPGQPTLLLRFAQHGRRLFTPADARLCDRLLEQMRRAVAYDRGLEQARAEERSRIAQDLHDDIGARLLTLMYRAPTPEVEDYLRDTLKDLKTLTRGLAARAHTLGSAAAEWKAELQQRLTAAGIALDWRLDADTDPDLSVVQWSALTRVLRELVSNTIAHAGASRVEVDIVLSQHSLVMTVSDDGKGRAPEAWSHGLGLGGVRKRVKQLDGDVRWREHVPRGIVCEMVVPDLRAPRGPEA